MFEHSIQYFTDIYLEELEIIMHLRVYIKICINICFVSSLVVLLRKKMFFGPEDNLFSGEEIMDFVERKKSDDLSTHPISFFLHNLFDAGLLDFVKLRNIIGPNRLRATMYK